MRRTRLFMAVSFFVASVVGVPPAAAATSPTFVGVQTARTTGSGFGGASTSLTVSVPAGTSGDLLIAVLGVGVNPSTATPSGWTPILAGFNAAPCATESGLGIRCQLNTWYRIADGTETSVTFTWGGTFRQAAGAVLRYSDADTVNPIGAHATQSGTSTTPTAPSVTVPADTRVLRIAVADINDADSVFTATPAVSRFNLASTSTSPGDTFDEDGLVLGGSDSLFAAGGATGTASWSLPATEQWRTISIPILPVPTNVPPIADANGPYIGDEGTVIPVDGSGSLDDTAIALYEWDCEDDGTFDVSSTASGAGCTYGDNGTYTVRLRVTDGAGASDEDTTSVTVNNVAPTVTAPIVSPEPSVEAGAATASAGFSDLGTSDGPFTCTVDYGDGTGPVAGTVVGLTCNGPAHVYADNGSYTVSASVTDKDGGTGSGPGALHQVLNVPPVPDAGADQTVYRHDTVTVSGSWTDPAGAADNPYAWWWDLDGDGVSDTSGSGVYGDTIVATTSFALEGDYTLTFSVTDKDGGAGSDSLVVEVLNRPPDCTAAYPSLATLWSPNHRFVPITVGGVTDPEGDPLTITIDGIFQDEPVRGQGSGRTSPDARGVGTATAEVRAERAGTGNGRVYHVSFTADDGHGGSCSGEVLVGVPHSRGRKGTPVDDGPLHDSLTWAWAAGRGAGSRR